MDTKRIEWCDIYKGIMIILVVVGHATGKFNPYIYQFHMAAFFFISGYTSKLREDANTTFIKQVFKKAYKLILPYLTIELIGLLFFYAFYKTGVLNYISTTEYPIDGSTSLLQFFRLGIRPDWLGAMWFLPVLFMASIFVDFLAKICKRDGILLLVSILLSMCSIEYSIIKGGLPWNIHLAGIAQGFIAMGYIFRKLRKESENCVINLVKCLTIALLWLAARQYCGLIQVMDWPSNTFNGLIDLVIPLMGILFTTYLSEFLSRGKYIKKLLMMLGKNSIGIMCFHFIGFKMAYLVLIIGGKMGVGSFKELTPVLEIQNWWFFISGIAIVFSVIGWRLLQKIYISRVLLGAENFGTLLAKINFQKGDFEDSIINCYYFFVQVLKEIIHKIVAMRKIFFVLCGLVVLCLSAKYANSISMNSAKISITFPYNYNNVTFGEGWLEQSEGENYRWVGKHSELSIWLHEQKMLHIEGYVPEHIQDMTTLKIFINNNEISESAIKSGQQILCDIDISQVVQNNASNKVQLEFDGVRVPAEEDQDKRIFSALISKIDIQ